VKTPNTTILVVEDEPTDRALAVSIIEDDLG
jgi:CheY-like chemotaxis protein